MTDSQWHHIRELFEKKNKLGRPRELDLREVVNAILKDYEVFPKTSETFIIIAMTRLMLRRLQPL